MEKNQRVHRAWMVLAICFIDLFVNYTVRLGYTVVLLEIIRALDFGRASGAIYNS